MIKQKSSEEQYKILFENNPQPMWVYDKDTLDIIAVNISAVLMYGYTREEFLTLNLADIRPKNELEKFYDNVAKTPPHFEKSGPWAHRKKDGSIIYVEVTSNNIFYNGKINRLVLLTDVTEKIENEKNVVQLAAIVQSSDDAIYSKDLDNIITSWNKGAEKIYGYSPEQIIGQDASILYPKENTNESKQVLNKIKQGTNIRQHETIHIKNDNEIVNVSLTFSPIHNKENSLVGFAVISRDITRRKKNEKEIFKAFEREKIALAKAEEQQVKLKFLAEASNLLNSSLDYEETLAALGSLVTPKLADWFAVDLFDENNKLVRITVSHDKYVKYKFVEKFMQTVPFQNNKNSAIYKAINTRRPILFSDITPTDIEQNVANEEQFKILKKLGLHSIMIIPLLLREKVLGVLIFINAESELNYSKEDLIFAEDLASRAAIAIENALLYKKESELNKKLDKQIDDLKNEIYNRELAEKKSKEHQEKLKRSEERFRLVLDATKVGTWSWNLLTNDLQWSDTSKILFGLMPEDEVTIDFFYDSIYPEDEKFVKTAIKTSIENKALYDIEYKVKIKSGGLRWIKALGQPFYDVSDTAVRFDGVIIDITESKNAQEEKLKLLAEIEHQQERINKLVADVPGVVWEAWGEPDEKNQRNDFVSSYAENMLGYTVDEWLSSPNFWLTIVHPDDKERAAIESKKIFLSKRNGSSRFRWVTKQGNVIWVESQSTPILDDDGNPVGMRGVTMDISNRIKDEERVQHLGRILENSLNEIYIFDADTLHFLQVNHGARKNTGYSLDELKELTPVDLKPEFTFEQYNKLISPLRLGEKERINFVAKQKRKDGTLYDVEVHLQYSSLQNPPVFVTIIQDITQHKKAEENLQASLNEKEVLLREVHHRVKNNLQIISSLLNLQSSYINDEKAYEYFQESQNRIKSMALIHEKLYRPKDLTRINFAEYLQDLISYLSSMYKKDNHTILFSTEIDDVYINMDAAINLGLIINELVSNCLKYAFPNNISGNISINLRNKNEDVELSVHDDGVGFQKEFDIDKANSLGLQLVKAFTQQLRGTLDINNTKGTKITINFPKPDKHF